MILLHLISILCIFIYNAETFGFRGLFYEGLKEPESSLWRNTTLTNEKWITQLVDHFHIQDSRTWKMRYLENDGYFNGTGPILIMLGGEWSINPGFLNAGLMHGIGAQHGALMYYTEHRFYGKSRPFENVSTKNLKYLNVDQALADVAYFIETVKRERKLNNTMVIVFGGSYAGNMAVWMRQKYPHLVQGALASSAPVYAKANFYEYLDVVTASLSKYNKQCVVEIKNAIQIIEKNIRSKIGKELIKEEFNLCSVPDTSSLSGNGIFFEFLTETFSNIVQYNAINNNGKTAISIACDKMTNITLGTPFQRLGKIVNNGMACTDIDYNSLIKRLRNESWDSNTGIMRQWIFQTCTEYGYFQTTDSKKSIFGPHLSYEYFTKLCKDIYGDEYTKILLSEGIKRTNVMYGGRIPDVQNVLFVNGNIDPWHALSILDNLNEASPSIFINGSSHCMDLQVDRLTDNEDLKKARKREREIIVKWIKTWKKKVPSIIDH
ncbi:putative serine protease K12H4.7 [Leptopilina boulardi]|uniref:putative serine protease K12H4.7 n=1 Tax=Leptopilina boulardi TaxID=63433 RepID=UPI0021F50395|nr:putative serine protease K12H4.7 [Leptopilina boulardi]